MNIGEKIVAIRSAEKLNQLQFSNLTGINTKTLQNYEQGIVKKYNAEEIQKITQHELFQKYTLWLMNGMTAPEAGQVSPEVEEVRGLRA
tara:strand:- start:1969 stop:2235 length:267 start_codon:yes stop_codon:yes gene_type:complete